MSLEWSREFWTKACQANRFRKLETTQALNYFGCAFAVRCEAQAELHCRHAVIPAAAAAVAARMLAASRLTRVADLFVFGFLGVQRHVAPAMVQARRRIQDVAAAGMVQWLGLLWQCHGHDGVDFANANQRTVLHWPR